MQRSLREKLANTESKWSEWGDYMETKSKKLVEQFENRGKNEQRLIGEEKCSNIFQGVEIYVNGYTDPPADELHKLVLLHGGRYHTFSHSSRITHVIAKNLPDTKVKQLKESEKVVFPTWITESIKSGKLLPWQKYQVFPRNRKTLSILNYAKSTGASCTAISSTLLDVPGCSTDFAQPLLIEQNKSDSNSNDSTEPSRPTDVINYELIDEILSSRVKELNGSTNVKASHEVQSSTVCHAGDPNFLSSFFGRSRLHHISTLAAELKKFVLDLQLHNKPDEFPGRIALKQYISSIPSRISCKREKVIMHIDMDCFFVSVCLRNRPDLIGKPVAVTHSTGTNPLPVKPELSVGYNPWDENSKGSKSDVASCSYEAREKGVKNGMWLGKAFELCPDLVVVNYDFEGYRSVSQILYRTIADYTRHIEAVSCDEVFVDCSDILDSTGASPMEMAAFIRQEIKMKTGCPCSAGLGPNMLLARLATKLAKPNGQFLAPGQTTIQEFMRKQDVSTIPGVGWRTLKTFKEMGIENCGQLEKISLQTLQEKFGNKNGSSLYSYCRGEDKREIKSEKVRKSVSADVNYGIRFKEESEVAKFMNELSEEVQSRLRKEGVKGKNITLKIMVRAKDAPIETAKFLGHGYCDSLSKSVSLPLSIDNADVIARECMSMLRNMAIPPTELRGIGIQIQKLEKSSVKTGTKSLLDFLQKKPVEGETSKSIESRVPAEGEAIFLLDSAPHSSRDENKRTSIQDRGNTTPRRALIQDRGNITPRKKASPSPRKRMMPSPSPKKKVTGSPSPRKRAKLDGQKDISEMFNTALAKQKKIVPPSFIEGTSNSAQLIDKDVFFNLPQDVRKEYENYYRSQGIDVQFLSMETQDYENSGSNSIKSDLALPNDIDPEVFNSLPEDLQKEILQSVVPSHSTVRSQNKKPEVPVSNKHQPETEMQNFPYDSSGHLVNLKTIKSHLQGIINPTNYPTESILKDIQTCLSNLISDIRLDDAYAMLNTIQSLVESSNRVEWSNVLPIIISDVQEQVKSSYGATLKGF